MSEFRWLFEPHAVKHLLHLHLVRPYRADRDGFTFEATATHGLEGSVVQGKAFDHRPFVIAIRKVVLCFRAGQVLQKLDGIGRVFAAFCHAAARNVDMGSPGGLIGENDPNFVHDGFVFGAAGFEDTCKVVSVRHGNGALT